MIGPAENNSTDGVIIRGIKYLLKQAYKDYTYKYAKIADTSFQTPLNFHKNEKFDLVVVCGTPWLWDSFQYSLKYLNAKTALNTHPEARRVFFGIGSCLYLSDMTSNILERPEEQEGMDIFRNALVIVRDSLAFDKLIAAEVPATLLPCPAFFSTTDILPAKRSDNVLIFQDPGCSISGGVWRNSQALADWKTEVLEFIKEKQPKVYCANTDDLPLAKELGLNPAVLMTADDTIKAVNTNGCVLSGRVHCAVPAQTLGAKVTLKAIDSRHLTLEEFRHNYAYGEGEYIRLLTDLVKPVGTESQRTHLDKLNSGFYSRFMSGIGLDIGYTGYTEGVMPILPTATGVDLDYPGYDGKTLPFSDNSQDYVYSSHCLEHITDWSKAISEWFRVLKINGYLIIIVPHKYLYEKKAYPPSRWNEDHKRFYTPGSLLNEVDCALTPNSYRIRLLEDGDKGFNYSIPPEQHSSGQYEITLVLQKINPPGWTIS